ncbi:MAG: sigma 54-interacting transcriptional regulator [Desulfobacterales bacterium]|jgi:PAS domain S-box-containing protein
MSPLIIAQFIMCGICLAIGLLHLAIYGRMADRRADLFFALMCFSTAAGAFFEGLTYQASTIDGYNSVYRFQVNAQALLWFFMVWFIAAFTGAARRWLAILVASAYLLAILINTFSPYGILYSKIALLKTSLLPWGERIVYAAGPTNPWRLAADSAWLLMIYLMIESCVRLGRHGQKRRALFFSVSLFVCLGPAYLHGTLVDLDLASPPFFFNFAFMALILVMSAYLVREVVKVSVLSRKVAADEKRWRSLMENVSLLAIGLDPQGWISYVNPYFEKVSGYNAEEALGRPIAEFVPAEEREDLSQRLQAARGGQVRPHSTRLLLTKDGDQRHISWFHVIERESGDQISGILSIGEDVTELKQAQRKLADEKANMDVILSSLNTGLALMDPELNVIWGNEMTRKAFPWDDPVGKKCYSLAENRSEPCQGCGALAAFADGCVHETERLNSMNNRWYHIVSVPIKDESGRIIQVLESSTDITERKHTEAARDSALQELEALKAKLEEENIYLRQELQNQSGFDEIVGESNSLLYVLTRVKQVAETDASVLIQGETGVGKELVARAIHQSSRRADKPFIKLNCAALPLNLVESELFGHEKGAFTGADQIRKGRFELAHDGTLLLDEISELPLETQAKLLRVLQEGQLERVGGSETLSVDVRIIATTNRKLKDEVVEGQFRSDLYYRLNVYPLTVPPLRERLEDIPLLVRYFVTRIADEMGKKLDQVPPFVVTRLREYDWPGNVRELRNVLEQAVIHSPDHILELPRGFADLPSEAAPSNITNGFDSLKTVERQHIVKVLEATGWRISGPKGAATILGLNPSTLRFRMKKLGIRKNR